MFDFSTVFGGPPGPSGRPGPTVPGSASGAASGSGAATVLELGDGWILDASHPDLAVVSLLPSSHFPLPVVPGSPGVARFAVIDAGTMPAAVQAKVNQAVLSLPSTVEIVIDGLTGPAAAPFLRQLELAGLRGGLPDFAVEPTPAGYAIARADAPAGAPAGASATSAGQREGPALPGSTVIRLDPSIDNLASVGNVLSAVRAAVPGHIVAAVVPAAPIEPAIAARTAVALFRRTGVGMVIASDDLTAAPATGQFMPFGTDHFFVLPAVPSNTGSSAASANGTGVDSASVTGDTNLTVPSLNEVAVAAVATPIESGVFVHGEESSPGAMAAARAMPRSRLGQRVLVDAPLVGAVAAVDAALADTELTERWFIDLELVSTELTNTTVMRMADKLRAPVRVAVNQLSDAPPTHAIALDDSDGELQGSGVATAVLIPPRHRVPRPGPDPEGSTVDRLAAWRDHLDQLIDDARPSLGPAERAVSLLWANFSRQVDLATAANAAAMGTDNVTATGSTAGAASGSDTESAADVDERLAAAAQAYVRTVDRAPSQLSGLPTLAEVLGRAPPLAPLPNLAGGQGPAVMAVLARGVNQLVAQPRGRRGSGRRRVERLGRLARSTGRRTDHIGHRHASGGGGTAAGPAVVGVRIGGHGRHPPRRREPGGAGRRPPGAAVPGRAGCLPSPGDPAHRDPPPQVNAGFLRAWPTSPGPPPPPSAPNGPTST